MSDVRPGWYADPSGQADLRWWDGQTWSASTRAHTEPAAPGPPATPSWELPTTELPAATMPGAAAPFTPPGAATPDPAQVPNPTPADTPAVAPPASWPVPPPVRPPVPPPAASPGSFAEWGGVAAVPAASAPAGWGATAPAPPGPGDGRPPDDRGSRSWLPWALTGAGVALIVILIGFMAVSILGSSSTPSSRGLSATGSSTTATEPSTSTSDPGSSTSSTAPTTTVPRPTTTTPAGPPGSVLYRDPGGTYSVSVGPSWTRTESRLDGVPIWYIPPSPGASRATFDVTSGTLPYSMGLAEFAALTEQQLRSESSITVLASDAMTLADGVPATRIRYETAPINGVRLQGEAVIAVGSSDAYVETVTARPGSADVMFAIAAPYLRTLHVED